MYNLVKMEQYKLFKSISAWVIVAVIVAFGALAAYATSADLDAMADELENMEGADGFAAENFAAEESAQAENEADFSVGIYFDTDYGWINEDVNVFDYFIINLQSGIYMVLLSIFTAIFVFSEYSDGYIKNIAGQITYKGKLVLAKLPSLLSFVLLIFLVSFLTNILFVRIFVGSVDFELTASRAKIILIQLLLHFAFVCVVMLVTSISRSKAAGIVVGLVFSTGFGVLLWMAVNLIARRLGAPDTFDIGEYTIVQNINSIGSAFDFDGTARILAVGIGFIIASVVISLLIANKRDVK